MSAAGTPGTPPVTGKGRYLVFDLLLLFAVVPALFLVDLSRALKVTVIIAAFVYVTVHLSTRRPWCFGGSLSSDIEACFDTGYTW